MTTPWRIDALTMSNGAGVSEATMTVTVVRLVDGHPETREITLPLAEADASLWRAYEDHAEVFLLTPRPQLYRDGVRLC